MATIKQIKANRSNAKKSTGSKTPEAAASPVGAVTIRKCETLADMEACFTLQKEVWRFSDADLIPVRLFVVADKIGGQVIGAYLDKSTASKRTPSDVTELVGFALAIPDRKS